MGNPSIYVPPMRKIKVLQEAKMFLNTLSSGLNKKLLGDVDVSKIIKQLDSDVAEISRTYNL